MYLTAVIDWHPQRPEKLNTDQGAQVTGRRFIEVRQSWANAALQPKNYFFLPPPLPPPLLESVTLRLIRLDQSVVSPAAIARTRK